MDNYLLPHTKSSVITGIYKYQDFVRTRQQMQVDENPQGESDATPKLKSLPVEIHGNNAADRRHHQSFFQEHASQLNQQSTLNKQFSAQQKPYSFSNKNYVQLQQHQHSNSFKSPKIAKNCATDAETHTSLELVGGGSTQATSTNQHLSISQQNATGINGQNIKLMSRSHLTSAHQHSAKQDSFVSAKPESVNSGDLVTLQIGHQSHENPNARASKLNQQEFILEGQSPSILIDSRSDKIGQRTHKNRMVKLNQSAFRDQSAPYNKAKSPTQMQTKGQRIHDPTATEMSMSAKITSNISANHAGQLNFHQGSYHHPVYQTIAKIGENNLLSGNMNKIKNQFVQKSGHITSPQLVKEGERPSNNISVYQSENYSNKNRDIQNFSGNSHYTQLNNKVVTLKQNSSGLMQQTNNGGMPTFIQRNQAPWHSISNPPYSNAAVAGSSVANVGAEAQNSAKSGQACILPQILMQKDGGPQIQSVLEVSRPAPIQAHVKKINADQQARDFPEYFNLQQNPSEPATGDSYKTNQPGQMQNNGAVSSSATFKKSLDSNYNNQDILLQQNRNNSGNSGRKNELASNPLAWQSASTSRKQMSSKIQSALESGKKKFQQQQTGVEHHDNSGAYEINVKSGGVNAIKNIAIKSAAQTVGPGNRIDSNSIQFSGKQDPIKMNSTGDIAGSNTKSSNQRVPNVTASGRKQEPNSEYMRLNSGKNQNSNIKNTCGLTASHKSPQQPIKVHDPAEDVNIRLKEPEQQIKIESSDASGSFAKKKQDTGDLSFFKLNLKDQKIYDDENSPTIQTNADLPPGLQFTYDLGDQPEEEEDEINNTDGEEGEEEQDDILIVEGEDEDLDDEDEDEDSQSPNLRRRSANNLRPSSNRSSKEKDNTDGLDPIRNNKSLNASQEEAQVQSKLYGGDIYLLGGSHFLMQEQVKKDGEFINKFSQSSTTAESEMLYKGGALKRTSSSMKNRGTGRGRKRSHVKNSKHLQKIQERNSDLEAGGDENATQVNVQDEQEQQKQESIKILQIGAESKIDTANMTEKQKKHALRDEFLLRPPNQIVTMIKSPFPSRDPYIFFPYPPFIGQQRTLPSDHSRIVQYTQEQLKPYCNPGFRVLSSTHTYNCVVNALKMAGFRHVTGSAWNVIWSGLFRQGRLRNMNSQQHINHFAGSWCLGRKDYLWRNVQRMRRLHGKAYDIAPATYIFPEDYKRWMMDREASNFKNMYIMKPNASSCGRGIKVIGKKQTVNKRSNYIVSKYVSKPHLIRGYKYDLRLYVLVTSFDPVKIYLFKDGLVRLATVQYSTSKSSLKQRFVHLTNYSVNKKAETYIKNTNSPNKTQSTGQDGDQEEEKVESKLSFLQLRQEYKKMGVDYNEVFGNIKDLIIKTVFAAEQPILQCMGGNKNKNACFEVYGFDVLIDANLRPWLLEVNVSPSLSSSSPLDKQIKTTLLSDTLYLIGFRLLDRKQQEQEKAKQNKQRLLGFESTKAKMQHEKQSSFAESSPVEQKNSESWSEINTSKEPKSGGYRSRQILSNNAAGQFPQNGELNAFVSNDSHDQPDKENVGLTSSTAHLTLSPQKSSSPNRRRTTVSKLQPPKPWLKDFGEPMLAKGATSGQTNTPGLFGQVQDGFVTLNDNDLEMLADFEEEQQRRGNYELLFPTAKNIEPFRSFMGSNRRANLVLWAYIKQGAPMHHLVNQFKYIQQRNQSIQQQSTNNNAPM